MCAGDIVGALGLDGLGRVGVQYAAKPGFRTVGVVRGKDKESLARTLPRGLRGQATLRQRAERPKTGEAKRS